MKIRVRGEVLFRDYEDANEAEGECTWCDAVRCIETDELVLYLENDQGEVRCMSRSYSDDQGWYCLPSSELAADCGILAPLGIKRTITVRASRARAR